MKKSLVLTLDLRRDLGIQKNLFLKYKDYIKTVNVDIPFMSTHNKSFIKNTNYTKFLMTNKDEVFKKSLDVVEFLKSNDILVGTIINNDSLEPPDLYETSRFFSEFTLDELTLKKDYYLVILPIFKHIPKIILSRYNFEDDIATEKRHGVTVKTTYFKEHNTWVSGVENRILLNYCCPLGCTSCMHEAEHFNYFDAEWKDNLEEYVANRIWTGNDIEKAYQNWPEADFSFKIATRLWQEEQEGLDYFIETYIESLINKDFNLLKGTNALSFALINSPLQEVIREKYNLNNFDFNKFNEYKK